MLLSCGSRHLIEEFFRDYSGDAEFYLPKVYFFTGIFASVVAGVLQIQGITVGSFVYVAPRLVFRNRADQKSLPEDLIVHEITHVLQYRKNGFFRFLWKYFGDYRRNLQKKRDWSSISRHEAYLEIPFEIEARQTAAAFKQWKRERNS